MKRSNLYSVFALSSILLFALPFIGFTKNFTMSTDRIWEDDNFGITLDKVERTDVYPVELKGPGYNEAKFPSDGISKPKEGWDFVVIYFTISHIENTHIVGFGSLNQEHSILYDANGHKYEVSEWKVRGMQFSDLSDIRSPRECIEGAKGYLIFKMPQTEKPDNLSFVYYSKDNLDDESANKNQLEINF